MKTLFGYGALVFLAVALDQWIKMLVENELPMHQLTDVVPFVALFRTHNTGIAFSMLSGFGVAGLIVLTLAVVAFVSFLALRTAPGQTFARLGFALIVGGAIGNLIDRLVLGYVVDYILLHTATWSFAIFNLADAFITVGAGLVVLQELISWRKERTPPSSSSGGA